MAPSSFCQSLACLVDFSSKQGMHRAHIPEDANGRNVGVSLFVALKNCIISETHFP